MQNRHVLCQEQKLSDEAEIIISKGSHPVLSTNSNCSDFEFNYYPNDTELNEEKRMMLLTGPNMSGKSTYMKQVALIAILGLTDLICKFNDFRLFWQFWIPRTIGIKFLVKNKL